MEQERNSDPLPAGLAWSNTLATLDAESLFRSARRQFKALLESRPDDVEMQERVQGYFDTTRERLSQLEASEGMLEALGTYEDLVEPKT